MIDAPGAIITPGLIDLEQVLDAGGKVRASGRAAQERGVVLDVGHASIHCDVHVARRALGKGLLPTTLNTDLHTLWQRLLGRPASESGRLCHGDRTQAV